MADWRLRGCQFRARSVREVLLGSDPDVLMTDRPRRVLAEERDDERGRMHPAGTLITRDRDDVRWWTWAGFKANAILAATVPDLADSERQGEPVRFSLG